MTEGEYRQLYLNVCLASPADRREEEKRETGVRTKQGQCGNGENWGKESEVEKDYFGHGYTVPRFDFMYNFQYVGNFFFFFLTYPPGFFS